MTVIQVRIDALALKAIDDELGFSAPALREGRETGGWLWASQDLAWWRDGGLTIEAACGPGPRAERKPGALTLDTEHFDQWDAVCRREGLEAIGLWHCHPGGDDQPSEADEARVEAQLHFREVENRVTPRVLELILTPAAGDQWRITPWVFHRSGGRRVRVAEGAVMVESVAA